MGITSFHLEADAQLWFLKLKSDFPSLSWEGFKEECNLRFGPVLRCTRLVELSKLQQTGSVEDYQRKFVQHLARAESLTNENEVEIFISGLQEPITVEILIHLPMSLSRAMHLARLYESRTGGLRTSPQLGAVGLQLQVHQTHLFVYLTVRRWKNDVQRGYL